MAKSMAFITTNAASHLILVDFINRCSCISYSKNCHVASFVDIFANVLDRFHQIAILDIIFDVFESNGEYSTTQPLSTSIDNRWVVRLPPSSVDCRQQSGYPLLPVIVSASKSIGYYLVHFPSDMYGELLLSKPHGP